MIPKKMEHFLREVLPERTWNNRLVRENGRCFMEFGAIDVERLGRLGIHGDSLGPKLVACLWDEESELEVGGYLVVDNLAMGRPSMGGIRMLPDLTPEVIFHRARGMTLKNAAANLPYGGGKAGILAERDLSPEDHAEVIRRFARLLFRFRDVFLPGPDVGTNDADMKLIAIENGLDHALSKPVGMGGNRVDELGAGGCGLIIALEALLKEMPRMQALPQFCGLQVPAADELTLMTQGFGAVGSHAARFLAERLPGARVVGISDGLGYLYNEEGVPVEDLFAMAQKSRSVTRPFYQQKLASAPANDYPHTKFSNTSNDLLRENAFCLIPAAHIANYLDTEINSMASMTVERMGKWSVIVEGANTYSPDPARKAIRARMERAVYRGKGVIIATDYLVNSGGVIFAAQEHLIKTPQQLRIPEKMLGQADEVEAWLSEHAVEFEELADKRRQAGEAARDKVIRRNMKELVDLLVTDADMLPCDAAERISVGRIAAREKNRTAADVMERIITIAVTETLHAAAKLLVEAGSPMIAVVSEAGEMVGVITDWDIARASAQGLKEGVTLERIMTRQVVAAAPSDTILELVRKLEYHEISALPVVEKGKVLGMVTTDLLSRRTLLRLLTSRVE